MADQHAPAPPAQDYTQLLWLVSHELRTPLSVARGYLQMLQRDTQHPISDRHRQHVIAAEKACLAMAGLLGELNEIRKLDEGRPALQHEAFDLLDVLQQAVAIAREAADRGVRLSLRSDERGAPARGDGGRLLSAFASLFRTVLREQPDSAEVVADFRTTHDGARPWAVVAVAKDDQLDSARAASPAEFDKTRGGMGLTLPIAQRTVERHGGRLWSPAGKDGAAAPRGAILISIPLAP